MIKLNRTIDFLHIDILDSRQSILHLRRDGYPRCIDIDTIGNDCDKHDNHDDRSVTM